MVKIDPLGVMHVSAAIAGERGLDAVTMTAVAAGLGVRPPSLYGRFSDREGLLDRLSAHAIARLADGVADALAGRAGRDAIAAVADAHLRFAAAEPGLWSALQRPLFDATVATSEGLRLVGLVRSALRDYQLPEAEIVHAVRLLGATINGFVALDRSGGFAHSEPASSTSWERAVDALHLAFSNWPGLAAMTRTVGGEP